MKILVTGAGGFLGRALTISLATDGHEVVAMDNDSRGNLNTLPVDKSIRNIRCDILNFPALCELTEGVDVVYHLAYINGTKYFYEIPGKILEVGIIGTHNVLKASLKNKVPRFYLASSSEVYQDADLIPTPESITCKIPDITNPRYSYGGGKIACELLTINYLRGTETQSVIFRPHNIYGPQMGHEHVVPELIRKIYKQKALTERNELEIEIQGSGHETRSFMFIDDAIKAIGLCTLKNSVSEIYHIGNMDERPIIDILNVIAHTLNVKVSIKRSESPKGGTPRRCPDNSKIGKLGYKQGISLEEGIRRTVEWYWDYYSQHKEAL